MLRIFFECPDYARITKVFMIDEKENGNRYAYDFREGGQLALSPIDEGDPIKPTFIISGQVSREFFPALSEALVRAGHRPDTTFEAGQLVAVKEHLRDMRALAGLVGGFKKDGVET